MGDEIRLRYVPREDATLESEARALGEVYCLVLRAYEQKKKGAGPGTPNDAKEAKNVRADESILP
jgi:hypothetical protein